MLKPLIVDHNKLENSNELVQNWERNTSKAVYCHPAYLTYMQSTSYKIPDWMNLKLESRLRGEISVTSDM